MTLGSKKIEYGYVINLNYKLRNTKHFPRFHQATETRVPIGECLAPKLL